jgi:hypothetical protein
VSYQKGLGYMPPVGWTVVSMGTNQAGQSTVTIRNDASGAVQVVILPDPVVTEVIETRVAGRGPRHPRTGGRHR